METGRVGDVVMSLQVGILAESDRQVASRFLTDSADEIKKVAKVLQDNGREPQFILQTSLTLVAKALAARGNLNSENLKVGLELAKITAEANQDVLHIQKLCFIPFIDALAKYKQLNPESLKSILEIAKKSAECKRDIFHVYQYGFSNVVSTLGRQGVLDPNILQSATDIIKLSLAKKNSPNNSLLDPKLAAVINALAENRKLSAKTLEIVLKLAKSADENNVKVDYFLECALAPVITAFGENLKTFELSDIGEELIRFSKLIINTKKSLRNAIATGLAPAMQVLAKKNAANFDSLCTITEAVGNIIQEGVDPDTYLEFGLNPIIRALEDRFEVLELKNVLASVAELAKLAKEANFAINYIIPVAVVPAIKALGSRFEISQVPSIGEVLIKLVKQEEIEKLNANIYHSLHYGIAPLIEVLGNDFEISKLTQIAYQTFRVTGQARILGSSDSRFLSSGFVPVAQALAKFNCLDLETLKIAAGYFIDSAKIATAVHGKQRARQSSLSAKFNYDQLPGIFASALTQTINHLGEVNELNTENLKKVVAIIEKAVASNEDVSQIVKYMLIPLLKAFSRESEISKALDFADRVVGEYSSSESIS